MCYRTTMAGVKTGARPGQLLMVLPVLVAGLIGPVHASPPVPSSPVEADNAVQLTSDQVLRRVVAWLDSAEHQQRYQQRQQQRALDGMQEQMDRMALELERLETKMDLKMDRLQEVLIGRDIKWDKTSRHQEGQLERTALLLTEVSGQIQRMDSNVKANLDTTNQRITTLKDQVEAFHTNIFARMTDIEQDFVRQSATGDVTAKWTNDVIPELRRLVDSLERFQITEHGWRDDRTTGEAKTPRDDHTLNKAGTPERDDHTFGEAETPQNTFDSTERNWNGVAERRGNSESTGQPINETEGRGLHRHNYGMENEHPALKLLEAMEQLAQQISSLSDQLVDGLDWLDERVEKRFRRLRENLAMMNASLRKRFFKLRDHLEEVAEKIIRLQSAAADGRGGDDKGGGEGGGGDGAVEPHVITAVEAAIYEIFDIELWDMLSAKLEDAVGGQENLTAQIGQMDRDMHQGFSKLYARLTRLPYDLTKSIGDPGTVTAEDQSGSQQLADLLGGISRQLHDIQIKLDRQRTATETVTAT